jgi:uncharacterized protein (PEP-CTERM system associated)
MAKARSDAQQWRQARPGSRDVRRNLKRFLALSAALPALLSCPAWAAKWDIVPTLSVGETYTDNVSLTPNALKQGDWVTQVTPGISIAATGARLRFNATYDPEVIYYARGQQNDQVFQRGNAVGNAELAKQLLFVDFGANVDQYNASLQAPLTTSNVNTTGNRATVETFFASPYLRREFGSDVQAEARFTDSVVNSDDPLTLSNSVADRINLGLKSGPAYKLLAWNLDYVRETIHYTSAQDTLTEVITANARRLITPTVGLLAQVGYENYESGVVRLASEERRWSTGFDWTPSPRTHLAATVGQRFFGDAYYFDFRHRTRLTTWSAGYSQNVTTTRSEFFTPSTTSTAGYLDTLFSSQFPDPVARQKTVDQFIAQTGLPPGLSAPINFFSNQLFLVKRWQASAGILGVRNVLIANVFKETSEALVGNLVQFGTGDFTASNSVRQTGTSLLWNWRMTAQNSWNLGGAYSRNEFPGTRQIDNLTFVGMGLTRQFQPRLSGSLNYRRQHNDSNQSASSYTENAVLATLLMRF